jgi:hypothetical protein
MSDFVRVVDLNQRVRVVNVRQVVCMNHTHPPDWDVVLTRGEPLALNTTEVDKLFKTEADGRMSSRRSKHSKDPARE